jgi:hypothetical protein
MEFFKKFQDSYNYVCKNKHYVKIIPPNEDEWIEFQSKLEKLDISKTELIYMCILHYNFINTKKMEEMPYGIKKQNNTIQITYSNLPYLLQHLLLDFIDDLGNE